MRPHLISNATHTLGDLLIAARVPHADGIDHEAEGRGAVELGFVFSLLEPALLPKKSDPRQSLDPFAFVQPHPHATLHLLIYGIDQNMAGFSRPPQFLHRQLEGIGALRGLQFGDHQRGGRHAIFERGA